MTNCKARALVSTGFFDGKMMSALKITQVGEIIQVEIEGKADGLLTYLSQAEFEMVQDFRREQETMANEAKIYRKDGTVESYSSTEQAVRDIQRLREYLNSIKHEFENPVTNIIECHKNQKETIKSSLFSNYNDLNKYQNKAASTAIYPGKGTALGLIYCALKLSGEAGEVADNVGKAIRDDGLMITQYENTNDILVDNLKDNRKDKIKLELGDVLWYVSQAAKELGFTLEEIAQENLDKLAARKDKGTLNGEGDDR